ncbi:MAG: HEPN domain-containing protein [Pyrinomonadaceae bacterium]
MKDGKHFNAGAWLAVILKSIGSYRTIHSFITSQEALHAFLKTMDVITGSEKGMEVIKDESRVKVWHDSISFDIQKAEEFYNGQMVVLANTYIELVLKDFLFVFFSHFPDRMYESLYTQDKQEQRGAVSLKEIVKVGSLAELIKNLAEQATVNVLKGRVAAQLNNLAKITRKEVPDDLRSSLISLVERRNRIVHEASDEKGTEEDVERALDSCLKLISFLAKVSADSSIPLDEYRVFNL